MAFQCGLVGLPNSGKSTLFNALTRAGAQTAPYPFCTIEPNTGVMEIADERLAAVVRATRPKKVVPAAIQFVDIAGLVKGASHGEGLGNQFLAHIREVDAILHVVRAFDDPQVPHVDTVLDPVRDIETVDAELLLADLDTVDKRREKTERKLKTGDRRPLDELALLRRIREALARGLSARGAAADPGLRDLVRELFLLTAKPVLFAVNVSEKAHDPAADPLLQAVLDHAGRRRDPAVAVPAKLEAEVAELGPEDQQVFLNELGWAGSALPAVVKKSFDLLNLVTFFTVNDNELHAWTVPKGTPAPAAAGKVHSAMEKGFIRAEVVNWSDLAKAGSMAGARDAGYLRIEGREYKVKDGDTLCFRFNS
ncbi:MAG TPA: redox-regulated ATPase YchF [Bacillota bacterium]